jgi:Holliday junction resolvasome RuvABC endonuclease subunit
MTSKLDTLLSNTVYVGLDLSSTNSGMVILDYKSSLKEHFLISPTKSKDFSSRVLETLRTIRPIIDKYITDGYNIEACIEGGALFGKGKRNELAMLNGCIYYMLLDKDIKTTLVPPSRLKKFATGNGRAGKGDMLEALPKSTSQIFQTTYKKYDDVVDAYFLAQYAYQLTI